MHEIEIFPDMSLLLNVGRDMLDLETTRVFAQTQNLSEKEEFHVTIIGRATGESMLEYLKQRSPEEQEQKRAQIEKLCTGYHPKIRIQQEFYFIQKDYSTQEENTLDIRTSVVQIVHMDGLDVFYEELFRIIPLRFSTPFPHVTLYTTSTRVDKKLRGIGIYSEADFWNMNPIKIG